MSDIVGSAQQKVLEETMKNQSLFARFAGGLSLMVMLSACGKNMSLTVPADQLAKENGQTSDNSKTDENKDSKDGNQSADDKKSADGKAADDQKTADGKTADGSKSDAKTDGKTSDDKKSTETVASTAMDDIGVLNPLSVQDMKDIAELSIPFTRDGDDEKERKTARVLFKVLPYESLMEIAQSKEVPDLITAKKNKGKQKIDPVTKKPMVKIEKTVSSGSVEMVLTLDEKQNGLNLKNFKICILADLAESDACRTFDQLKEKGAVLNDPNADSALKIDLIAAFGLNVYNVFAITDEVNLESGAESKYFRKLLLSFNGVKSPVGAKLEVKSGKREDATLDEVDYNNAQLENVAKDDLIQAEQQ
jgi:hypothetical protein